MTALRSLVSRAERGITLEPPTEVHAIRLGPVTLMGSGLETFQAIKSEVKSRARSPIPLVMSLVSDSIGYAPDKTAAARGGYAADMVPLICGELPFADITDELTRELLALDAELTPGKQ